MPEVLEYSTYGAASEDQATRQAFYRSRHQIEARTPGLKIEDSIVNGRAVMKVVGDPPLQLIEWLYDHPEYIKGHHWDRYLAARVAPPATPTEANDRMLAAGCRILVTQGRTSEALAQLAKALDQSISLRQKMALTLVWAFAASRSGNIREFKRAQKALSALANKTLPMGDLADRLLMARVRIEQAYGKYLAEIMGRPRDEHALESLEECELLLKVARKLQAGLSPSDQARLENVGALLTKARGLSASAPDRARLLTTAQRAFQRAFALAESVGDAYAMGAALYNIGELCYARDRLDRMAATEEEATEALSWFRQSVAIAEHLGMTRDLYVDYARVADVTGTLVLARLRAGRIDGVQELMADAHRHLDVARTRGNPLERKLARWTATRLRRVERAVREWPVSDKVAAGENGRRRMKRRRP
jgi:tetratricopeptide (TPR) repeat protein